MSISRDQRVLVTGGTGVLGAHVVRTLLHEGFSNIEVFTRSGKPSSPDLAADDRIEYVKGDVRELYPLTDSVAKADYIIHAAAIVSFDPRQFTRMHAVNVEGTANVVNLASSSGVKKIVHVSSIAALGRSEKNGMISESTTWVNSKYNSYYGITKYLAEQEVWRSHHEGLSTAIVNPSVILGDGAWEQSSLQIFKRAYDGLPFYPTGGTGIVDVKDVSRFIVTMLTSNIDGERFVLSAENISYKNLFEKICESMGKKPPVKPASKWMLALVWRLEKIRCLLTKNSPLITKESVRSTAHQSNYDNSKSLPVDGFEYRSIDETIAEYGKKYAEFRSL